MKTIIRNVIVAASFVFAAYGIFAHSDAFKPEFVDGLVPDYLGLKEALAGDDLAAAQTAAKELLAAAEKGPDFPDFTAFTQEVINAADIQTARTNFSEVSSELITLIDHVGTTGSKELFVARCPMAFGGKGGEWVQADRDILNPYFGSMMLHCGSITRTAGEEEEH